MHWRGRRGRASAGRRPSSVSDRPCWRSRGGEAAAADRSRRPRLARMRIARFTTGDDPMYGIVQSKDGRDMVYGITGDPLYTEIRPTGTIVPLEDVRLLAPVIPRSTVVCMAKNYAAHAAELGNEVPEQPLLFLKPNTAVIGPGDPIVLPSYSQEVSLEAELRSEERRVGKECESWWGQ